MAIRHTIALSIVCAVPAALLLNAAPAFAKVRSIEVGPIWNQMDADQKCPKAARKAGGTWTGQWRTTRPGQMSECDVKISSGGGWHGGKVRSVEVGPIWNQMDADHKCPKAARREGGTWTGQWRTTRPGMMSECGGGHDFHIGGSHVVGTYNGGGGSNVSGTYNGGSSGGWHGVRSIEVGPIFHQIEAERKCPEAARKEGGTWTGHWRTTRPGMSECDIKR
jgi:hypothetical protein